MVSVLRLMVMSVVIVMVMAAAAVPLIGAAPAPVAAQDASMSCTALYERALIDMMANCFEGPDSTLCAASGNVTITMQSGQSVNGPGNQARMTGVDTLDVPADSDSWALASLYLPDTFSRGKQAALLVFGPTTLTFESAAGLPPGAAFKLETGGSPVCSDLPQPAVLVQSPEASLTMLRINDTDLAINGMALISTRSGGTLQVSALTKETILGQSGTVVFAGYTVSVTGEYAGEVTPYDAAQVANLPIEILPEIQRIALPGNAMVNQEMNLYFEPGPEYYGSTIVNKGLPVNVFGRNSSGDWLHVRTYEGFMGWMPTYVLDVNVPVDLPVYDEAPPSPVRPFGSVQGYIKTSYEFNNLREGPGEGFGIVVTVPIWTDLALYGRSLDDAWLLVETLDGERVWISRDLISKSTPYTLEELPYPPDTPE